jgi:hypothetical protein
MSFIASQPGGGGTRLNLERLREARLRLQQQETRPMASVSSNVSDAVKDPKSRDRPKPADSLTHAVSGSTSTAGSITQKTLAPSPRPALTPELLKHEAQQALPAAPLPTATQEPKPQAVERYNPMPHLPLEGKFGLPLQDIQHIAQASGFIGISQENIERAYLKRQSLFVDYRI